MDTEAELKSEIAQLKGEIKLQLGQINNLNTFIQKQKNQLENNPLKQKVSELELSLKQANYEIAVKNHSIEKLTEDLKETKSKEKELVTKIADQIEEINELSAKITVQEEMNKLKKELKITRESNISFALPSEVAVEYSIVRF